MADRLLDGRLAARLAELRAEGQSYDDIARILFAEAGVSTTAQTCRAWGRKLGLDEPATDEMAS